MALRRRDVFCATQPRLHPVEDAHPQRGVAETVRRARLFGIGAELRAIDWNIIVERVSKEVDGDAQLIEQGNREHPNITVFKGTGRFVKVLVDPESGEILGCHILGADASQEVANATRMRAPARAITQAIYVHPALPEVVQRAFSAIEDPGGW